MIGSGQMILLMLCLLTSMESTQAALVTRIVDHQTVEVTESKNDPAFEMGEAVLFRTKLDTEIGYGRVVHRENKKALVRILFREYQRLVLVGDPAELPNYKKRDPEFRGRHDLLTTGKVPSYFKRLAYLGPVLGPAHVLDQNEWMLGLSGYVQYGLTNDVTLTTQALYAVLGAYNIDVRAEVLDLEELTLTPGLGYAYSPDSNNQAYLIHALLSSKSYSRLRSYTQVKISLRPAGGFKNAIENSEIIGGTEYIFTNWNRLLLGPSYNIDQQAIGAFASYVWIWDKWHLFAGIKSQNIFNFTIGSKGILPNFDVMYRF